MTLSSNTENRPYIAVYGIFKNEEKFIKRYLESVKDADEIVLCDTGTTDKTNEIIEQFRIENPTVPLSVYQICVSPWRFDDAFNTALSLVNPKIDLCIALGLDEYLMDGWKECLLKHYDPSITRYFHKFSTIWPNGGASKHWHERIHERFGYQWKLPVHEILEYNGEEKIKRISDFWIYQKPDTEKSRSSYLPLLEQSVKERKDVWKSWSFLAGEYIRARMYEKAIWATDEALKISESDKGYLHKLKYIIYKAQNKKDLALIHLNQAIPFLANRREIRFEKAKYLHQLGRNVEAFLTIKEAEQLKQKITDYHFNESAWNEEFDKWKADLLELAKKEGLEL